MKDWLQLLILNSLFITGLYTVCMPAYIGYPIRLKAERYLGKWAKPICTCNVCMSSFWGTVWYFSANWQTEKALYTSIHWIIYIIILTGINKIVYERYIG